MRDQCSAIFRQAKQDVESLGLVAEESPPVVPAAVNEDSLATNIDNELDELQVYFLNF